MCQPRAVVQHCSTLPRSIRSPCLRNLRPSLPTQTGCSQIFWTKCRSVMSVSRSVSAQLSSAIDLDRSELRKNKICHCVGGSHWHWHWHWQMRVPCFVAVLGLISDLRSHANSNSNSKCDQWLSAVSHQTLPLSHNIFFRLLLLLLLLLPGTSKPYCTCKCQIKMPIVNKHKQTINIRGNQY